MTRGPESALSQPLLGKPQRLRLSSKRSANGRETFGNAFNSVVGSGLLGVPYAVSVLGLRQSVVALTGLAVLSCFTALQLSSLAAEFGSDDQHPLGYEELSERAYGRRGRRVSAVLLYSELIGVVGIFLSLLASSLAALGMTQISMAARVLLSAAATLPLLMLRNFQALSRLSFIGAAALLMCVAAVLSDAFYAGPGSVQESEIGIESTDAGNQLTAWGVLILAYAAHGQFPSLRAGMAEPQLFSQVLLGTFGAATVVNLVFGLGAACCYGIGRTPEMVLTAMQDGWNKRICLSLVLFNTWLKVPLPTFAAATLLERRGFQYFTSRVAVLAIATIIAIGVPGFAQIMGLVGLVTGAALVFVLPPLLELRLRKLHLHLKVFNWILIFKGLALASFGLAAALRQAT